jgi:hypothetical protein
MYLARVFMGGEPSIIEVNPYEFIVGAKHGSLFATRSVRRAPFSWTIMSFGAHGAAAIADTRASAIGAALCRLESKHGRR